MRLKSLRHNILSQKRNLWEFGWILSFSKDEISLNSCENKSWKVYLDCSPRRRSWPRLCSWRRPGCRTAATTAAGPERARQRSSSPSEVRRLQYCSTGGWSIVHQCLVRNFGTSLNSCQHFKRSYITKYIVWRNIFWLLVTSRPENKVELLMDQLCQ